MSEPRNRVVQVRRFGGPDGLEVVDAPLPSAGPGGVRVRVLASGLEYTDVVRCRAPGGVCRHSPMPMHNLRVDFSTHCSQSRHRPSPFNRRSVSGRDDILTHDDHAYPKSAPQHRQPDRPGRTERRSRRHPQSPCPAGFRTPRHLTAPLTPQSPSCQSSAQSAIMPVLASALRSSPRLASHGTASDDRATHAA